MISDDSTEQHIAIFSTMLDLTLTHSKTKTGEVYLIILSPITPEGLEMAHVNAN